jgi:hypothetical protein
MKNSVTTVVFYRPSSKALHFKIINGDRVPSDSQAEEAKKNISVGNAGFFEINDKGIALIQTIPGSLYHQIKQEL